MADPMSAVQMDPEMKMRTSWVAGAALMGLPLVATAQADPADPSAVAATPVLQYQSAFSDYKPWQDIQLADWRAVNDTVRDAKPGGTTAQDAAPSRAAPAPQAPSGHPGHGAHK